MRRTTLVRMVLIVCRTFFFVDSAHASAPAHATETAHATDGGEPPLRVMTLNVAHGAKWMFPPVFARRRTIVQNLDGISAVIRRERPDVVAMQEVDRASFWSAEIDHFARIQRTADYPYGLHGAHRAIDHGPFHMRHGTALLSNQPLTDPASHAFATSWTDDKGYVVATVPHGERTVTVVSVHLDPLSERTRRTQIEAMARALSVRPRTGPLVVLGDMNTTWKGATSGVGLLAHELGLSAFANGEATYSAGHPWRRIDWILISPDLEFRSYRTMPDVVSDHRGVVADIGFRAAEERRGTP